MPKARCAPPGVPDRYPDVSASLTGPDIFCHVRLTALMRKNMPLGFLVLSASDRRFGRTCFSPHFLRRSDAKNTKTCGNNNGNGTRQGHFCLLCGHIALLHESAVRAYRCPGSTGRGNPTPVHRGKTPPGAAHCVRAAISTRRGHSASFLATASSASWVISDRSAACSVASSAAIPASAARRNTLITRAWAYCT